MLKDIQIAGLNDVGYSSEKMMGQSSFLPMDRQ